MAAFRFPCRRRCRCLVAVLAALFGLTLVLRHSLSPTWNSTLSLGMGQDDVEADFRKRQQLYQDVCVARGTHVIAENTQLLQHQNLSVSVCYTPKVGCTFWRRVFLFLLGQGGNATSPFTIDRHTVHYKNPQTLGRLEDKEARELAAVSTRVVFTRNPYSRLWSAFVDKFILPDFWESQGRSIMEARTGKQVAPECPLNLTFSEFLVHTLRYEDSHWRPVSRLCQPCSFLPQLVGHMETFPRDAAVLLRMLGLPNVLQHFDHTEEEIRTLTRYYVHLVATEKRGICLTVEMVARQLWTVFQINGHLDPDLPFPDGSVAQLLQREKDDVALQEGVVTIMLEGRSRGRKSPQELRRHKHDVMARAYRDVNATLLRAIQIKFMEDFLMFGYDPWPDFIYKGRQDFRDEVAFSNQSNSISQHVTTKHVSRPTPAKPSPEKLPAKANPLQTPAKTSTAKQVSVKVVSPKQAPASSSGKVSQQSAPRAGQPAQPAAH